MVLTGLMENIRKFKARKEDIFVASFPKSGTTWLQEVVFLLTQKGSTLDTRLPGVDWFVRRHLFLF